MDMQLDEKRNLLCRAIAEKCLVQFSYDNRARIVEPFCCGTSKTGSYILRGFQIRGADKTKPLCWRLYELSEITKLSVTQHNFKGKRDEYNPEDTAMSDVFCCIPKK